MFSGGEVRFTLGVQLDPLTSVDGKVVTENAKTSTFGDFTPQADTDANSPAQFAFAVDGAARVIFDNGFTLKGGLKWYHVVYDQGKRANGEASNEPGDLNSIELPLAGGLNLSGFEPSLGAILAFAFTSGGEIGTNGEVNSEAGPVSLDGDFMFAPTFGLNYVGEVFTAGLEYAYFGLNMNAKELDATISFDSSAAQPARVFIMPRHRILLGAGFAF